MVSVGLFTVIMIIGITAIINVSNTYRQNRAIRSSIDNISFSMEEMFRNIRLGYNYRCLNSINDANALDNDSPLDGQSCRGISFSPFWAPFERMSYFIEEDNQGRLTLFKMIGDYDPNSDNITFMTSSDISINESSGFSIFGSNPFDEFQPYVVIRMAGSVGISQNNRSSFNLQTVASQRLLDINE